MQPSDPTIMCGQATAAEYRSYLIKPFICEMLLLYHKLQREKAVASNYCARFLIFLSASRE